MQPRVLCPPFSIDYFLFKTTTTKAILILFYSVSTGSVKTFGMMQINLMNKYHTLRQVFVLPNHSCVHPYRAREGS